MKKTIWTLDIDYPAAITDITYPLFERYASKIDADFKIISEREMEHLPVSCEKLQLHWRGIDSDWNIYVDADTIIHPDLFDITEHLQKDTVLHYASDIASERWKLDDYFRRDGRGISSCNWFTVASNWCLDLWTPPENSKEEMLAAIQPCVREKAFVTSEHLLDDYILSRNIARYGLKVDTANAMIKRLTKGSVCQPEYVWHTHMMSMPEKILNLRQIVRAWGIESHAKIAVI